MLLPASPTPVPPVAMLLRVPIISLPTPDRLMPVLFDSHRQRSPLLQHACLVQPANLWWADALQMGKADRQPYEKLQLCRYRRPPRFCAFCWAALSGGGGLPGCALLPPPAAGPLVLLPVPLPMLLPAAPGCAVPLPPLRAALRCAQPAALPPLLLLLLLLGFRRLPGVGLTPQSVMRVMLPLGSCLL